MIDLNKVVTVDFETYYDTKYSLRSKEHNTSSYIRDEQFVAHCVGIKEGEGETKVFWYEDVEPALRAIPWADRHLLCQNTAFDAFIMADRYQIALPGLLEQKDDEILGTDGMPLPSHQIGRAHV